MDKTVGKWQQAKGAKNFVFALNEIGVNEFSFSVSCHEKKKAESVATLACAAPQLLEALEVMTSLCRIKYGNLDPDVYAEIEKAESLIKAAKGE